MAEELIHKVVDEISFGLISPKDLRKQSVVEIQTPDTYDEDGAPITAGLMDGRLGTLEPRQRCKTCGNTAIRCPGHFGHIELAVPIVHIEFTKIIFDLLRATCRTCGRILLSDEAAKKTRARIERYMELLGLIPDEIYKEIIQEIKTKQCPHCASGQFKITFEKPTKFIEQTEAGSEPLTPSMIRERLERVSDEDLEILGFNPKHDQGAARTHKRRGLRAFGLQSQGCPPRMDGSAGFACATRVCAAKHHFGVRYSFRRRFDSQTCRHHPY